MKGAHALLRQRAAYLLGLCLCCFALAPAVWAQKRFDVAVIGDGEQYQLQDLGPLFLEELTELTRGEFDVEYHPLLADWSVSSVYEAMDAAYADPSIEMVLVLGFAGNQLGVFRDDYPKPTFLPLVFNPEILGAPIDDNRSGKKHLNFLADRVPVAEDIASFQRVVPFRNAIVLSDQIIIDALPRGPEVVRDAAPEAEINFVGHDGSNHDLLPLIPPGIDAVLLGGLPRLPDQLFDVLLLGLANRGIPSFSLVGENEVRRGALASDTVQTDFRRLARRNALNMQAVMLGEQAADQPIFFDGKRQLTINMETARRIGLSPRFDVLSEAVLISAESQADGPELDLETVARLALERNLDLAASEYNVRIGEQEVLGARANLLPQLSLGGAYTTRRDQALTRGAGSPERGSSAALTLNQLIYSESATSGYQQQRVLQRGRRAAYDAARLDSVLEATTAYLQALRADTQVEIQQDNLTLTKSNLELARDRVRVGSASNADIYRWEANLASARSAVLSALAARNQAYDLLNRVLNNPITTRLRLAKSDRSDPFTMPSEEFDELINNPRSFGWFVDLNVADGLASAPELVQLQSQIDAVERDVTAKRRAFWLPDFSLQAQYADSIDAAGLGSGTAFDSINDWNVSLNGSIPLFAGGSRRSDLSRSTLQLEQLALQRAATAERIEQNIRAFFHAAQASYVNIELSERGAEASRKNLELVSDAYGQGTVSIIDLLDAQNQSLSADLAANNAVHDFLIDIMNLQRATSSFDFLLPASEQAERNQMLLDYLQRRAAETNQRGSQ